MASLSSYAAVLLVLILIIQQGDEISSQLEECDLSKIKVSVHRTSTVVQGHREFLVVISNVCWCPQSNITLACDHFESVDPVDPSVLTAVNGSVFLLNGGDPLVNGRPFSFKYAWSKRFRFSPFDSQINC